MLDRAETRPPIFMAGDGHAHLILHMALQRELEMEDKDTLDLRQV